LPGLLLVGSTEVRRNRPFTERSTGTSIRTLGWRGPAKHGTRPPPQSLFKYSQFIGRAGPSVARGLMISGWFSKFSELAVWGRSWQVHSRSIGTSLQLILIDASVERREAWSPQSVQEFRIGVCSYLRPDRDGSMWSGNGGPTSSLSLFALTNPPM
jgi:hypothetical protein